MFKNDISILGFLILYAYINIFQLPYFAWTFLLTQNWFMENGLVIFKDVIYHHTPLPLFLIYGISKILGNNFFMLQAASFLMLILFGFGIYLTAKQISKRAGTVSFFLFIVTFPALFNNFNIEEMTSSLFALWAFYLFIRFYKTASYRFSLLFGAFIGLSFMSKQPSLLLLFPLIILLFIFKKSKIFSFKKALIYFGFGFFVSIFPFFLYFLFNNSLYEFYYWNIVFNLTLYPVLSKAYVTTEGIFSTLWLLLSILPAFIIIRRKTEVNFKFFAISLILATIFLYPSLLPSFLTYKALIFYPYPLILWSMILIEKKSRVIILLTAIGIISLAPVVKSFYVDYLPQNLFNREYILEYGENELAVADWLRKNTSEKEKIMNLGHHYVTTLAKRLPKNRYVYNFPWLIYPYEESSKEILSDPPRIVIIDDRMFEDWPFLEKEWRFIQAVKTTYVKQADIGTYTVYVKE